jgi:hypothetical protein
MQVWKKIGIAASLTAAAAVSIALAVPASADTGAQVGDAVGVGSDTLQNGADFVFDGSPGVAGGFNAGKLRQVDNIDATGDANGRATYDGSCGSVPKAGTTGLAPFCDTTTNQPPNLLAGSVVLRAGTKPVIRPNGSGGGIGALISDAASPGYDGLPARSIQFARASRLPNTGEITNCPTTAGNACGGLHVYQAATDNLGIAHVTTGFDGPAGLSADELYKIFVTCTITKWNQLPGNSSGSANTIHPLIPQSGSGTRNFFLQDLANAENITTTLSPGTCTRTVEEHDPTGIYADPTPGDAIEPFSSGKLTLINSGYFANGVNYTGTGAANGAYTPGFLTLESGTPGDTNPNYNSSRGLYFVVRQTDVTSTTPFEPGGTQNFVQALLTGGGTGIQSTNGQSELTYAGFTPDFADCGINPTSC